jgi:quercetin dioxygenase-like cupin family protein
MLNTVSPLTWLRLKIDYKRVYTMEIKRNGSQASIKSPADWFTGTVRIDPMYLEANDPARVTGASVTFEPGARTAWHSHPLGQYLIVTAGYIDHIHLPGEPP